MSLTRRLLLALLTLATSLCLAYAAFGAGLVVCTTPQATSAVGATFSGWEHSTFPEQDMASIAEGVRAFSVEGAPLEELQSSIESVIEREAPEAAAALEAGEIGGQEAISGGLAALEERYAMPQDALDHLKDCTPIFTTGRISTGVVGAFGIVGTVALALIAGRARAGAVLIAGGTIVGLVIVGLGAWAVIDFDSIFAWMHSLLFAQGTWTFDSSSLLIRLFPEAFWAAMAGLWVVSSLACAGLLALAGKLLRTKA